ncbi:MAG TPA: hypothetical protein VII98_16215 [Solirubrobacteraceae bacterium]
MRVLYVVIVLVLGFFNFLVGIPVGYAFELSAPTIYIASLVGCVGGTIALVAWGERLMPPARRAWRNLVRRVLPDRGERDDDAAGGSSRRSEWINALTEHHGAIALGLVGPFVIGGPATALLGVALGLRRTQLALGLAVSLSAMVTAYMLVMHAALR